MSFDVIKKLKEIDEHFDNITDEELDKGLKRAGYEEEKNLAEELKELTAIAHKENEQIEEIIHKCKTKASEGKSRLSVKVKESEIKFSQLSKKLRGLGFKVDRDLHVDSDEYTVTIDWSGSVNSKNIDKNERLLLLQLILEDIRGNWGWENGDRAAKALKLAKRMFLDAHISRINNYDPLIHDGRHFRASYKSGGYIDMEELHGLDNTYHDKSEEFRELADLYITFPENRFSDIG